MRKWMWLLMLSVFSPSVWAADLMMNDFAYGLTVDVPKGTAITALSIPEQIYGSTYRADLGDLRVFNAAGEPVPHMIRYARTQAAQAPWQTLAFFPLPETPTAKDGGYRVYVRTGPDGAVVSVGPQQHHPPWTSVRDFLIDLSRVKRSLAQLRLEWRPSESNLMATMAVDASDDLVNWSTVKQRAAISDIRYGGHRLLNNIISLDRTSKRYLRLRQLDSGPPVLLVKIDGRVQPEGRAPIRAFLKIDGLALLDPPGVFVYETTGAFPVDRVNLVFDQANSMADAILESRNGPEAKWVRRFKGLFYRIDAGNSPLTNAPHAVAISMDRYWRLTVSASGSTMGSAVPRLEVGYRPHDLFFIARGSGPFTLAFGNAVAEPLKVNVTALFQGIGLQNKEGLERWVMPETTRIALGGPQRLVKPPAPLPMRRIFLWSVLVAGVLVVALMSWRLARKLKM